MTAPEVLVPASLEEAVAAFGDGADVTVVAGGTILMPELTYGRLQPARALLLTRTGLDTMRRENGTVHLGATLPVAALEDAPEPLASAARHVADPEIRAQGTVGGNLCAAHAAEAPRGDLQAPLIALGARIRSTGSGGERTQPVEEFLAAAPTGRLVLGIEFEEPQAGAWAALDRPHAHDYTALAVSACRGADGSVRLAASGAAPRGIRLAAAEAAYAETGDAGRAGRDAVRDANFADDALASTWYREQMLPVLVGRALSQLEEAA